MFAASNLFASASSVVKFNGLNYDDWSEQIRFTLGIMKLDHAILAEIEPSAITGDSSEMEKSLYEAWERSNRLSLSLMRMTMAEGIKPSMPKTEKAKDFMLKIKECSQSDLADKSIVGSLMCELTTKKFDWSQPIHDHVTHMSNLAAKLKALGMEVSETFLVQFIMNSLPLEFSQFQVNYNTIKDKWNYQELKAMLVQEEGRLKKMKSQVANLVGLGSASSIKGKPSKKDKKDKAFMKGPESQVHKEKKCFFCKKSGHFKKDCLKRKAWFDKKGAEQYLFMGNRMKARIEGIGTYRLILDTGCHIDLEGCLYVPECSRNLVSVSRLDNLGFEVIHGRGRFSLYRKDYLYGTGTLFDSLYKFNLDVKFSESLFNVESRGIKRSASNESSAFLWHQRLGHISKERMMRLVKSEILPQLDFSDLDVGSFIGYPEKSKGYVFYCPNHSTRIVETGNARFIENGQTSGSGEPRKVDIQEIQVEVPSPVVAPEVVVPIVASQSNGTIEQHEDVPTPLDDIIVNEPVAIQEESSIPQESLRRSVRERRSAIPNDFVDASQSAFLCFLQSGQRNPLLSCPQYRCKYNDNLDPPSLTLSRKPPRLISPSKLVVVDSCS
ncbi:hypothetical protein V2J09_000789 [Rumex salicifolius]